MPRIWLNAYCYYYLSKEKTLRRIQEWERKKKEKRKEEKLCKQTWTYYFFKHESLEILLWLFYQPVA